MQLQIFIEPLQGHSHDDIATDAWAALAGRARDTRRIRLGSLVSSVTDRHPGVRATQVGRIDALSRRRPTHKE